MGETRRLLAAGYERTLPALSGHGYAEAARLLAGEWDLEQAIAETVRRTRQYARRQLAWFGRERRIVWIDAGDTPADDQALVRWGSEVITRLLG